MPDLSYLDPPIEVAAESPRLEMIQSRLRSGRMRPYKASRPLSRNCSEPLLVDLESADPEILRILSSSGVTRPLVILGEDTDGHVLFDALVVERDKDIPLLRGRLTALSRRNARATELNLRRETAREFGLAIPVTPSEVVPELLYLGDGSTRFLALQAALNERGVSVTAALSVHTATDYMKHRRFSAVLFDISPASKGRASLEQWISAGEVAFSHVPLFALVDSLQGLDESERNILASTSEILEHGAAAKQLAEHIDVISRKYLPQDLFDVSRDYPAEVMDAGTQLHARPYFEAHLEKQIEVSNQRAEPLSLLIVKNSDSGRFNLKQRQRLGEILASSLRDTDMPAVLGVDSFAISMPATPYRGAVTLCERFLRSVEEQEPQLAAQIGWRIMEKRTYHTARTLVANTVAGIFQRLRVA
ncbi:MAG: hypothetical protein GYB49_00700 [Alphaproteobacteria bacterium]|nr:hypothetical protein [Hyphomonas sp.]MBR9805733.1 hypothetical protein [Alphaproteobacteria bacterium]|tara:strand:- start:4597 stop:5850 length:1254 start_codon:yes stop_codon:yes gene_type:complete